MLHHRESNNQKPYMTEHAQRQLPIWTIRCRHNNDMRPGLEAVHERKKLRHDTALHLAIHFVALRRNAVNLINEDNRRGVFLRLSNVGLCQLQQMHSNSSKKYLSECLAKVIFRFTSHFGHNFRSVDQEEESSRFIRDSSSDQSLARTRRTVHEKALGRLDAETFEKLA